jgi:hypothetical protein
MGMIGFTSVHGSPGVSTLALAVAHHWAALSDRPAVHVEADPDGGILAARHGLALQPGLTDLAGAARVGIEASELGRYTQTLRSGVPVIVGHPAAEQTSAALRASATHLASALTADTTHDAVVDLGRLRPGTPSTPIASSCEVIVVVVRCVAEDIVTVLSRLSALERVAPIDIALIGRSPYSVDEVRRASGIDRIHTVALDESAVRSDPAAANGRRSAWSCSVRVLTESLVAGVQETRRLDARLEGPTVLAAGAEKSVLATVGTAA